MHWPHIDIPNKYESDYDSYLNYLVYDGAHKRYGTNLSPDCIERIELELNYLKEFCCAQYFIILHDIVKFARDNKIWIGAGRGRTVSSIICYCLFIDDIDPIRFGLSSYRVCWKKQNFIPDVDIDVSKVKRNKLFDYLRTKYGELAVLRVHSDIKWLPKIHPCSVLIASEDCLEQIQKEAMYVEDEGRDVFVADMTKRQFDEKGYLNYDFLSMDHVDLIGSVCNLIESKYGKTIDIANIDVTDNNVLSLFQKLDTDDIFQFNTSEMKDFMEYLQPSSFSDLVALNAMCRPSMMEMIPEYADRKNGFEDVPDYASANYILSCTYGIPIYRDQIIQILSEIGNLPYDISNIIYMQLVRRNDTTQYESLFKDGCLRKGIHISEAEMLWELISTYSIFTFDKSHATAYTYIAFQQAWLKTYYPSEFQQISSSYFAHEQQ